MELRQIEYFVAIAEEQHFGRAAERLFVGQPAVSQAVRRLERELGLVLFERTSRRVALTVAGEQFLVHARAVLAAVADARAAAAALVHAKPGELVVGTCAGLGDHVQRTLRAFAREQPDVRVLLRATPGPDRYQRVADAKVDLAFTHDREDHSSVESVRVWSDPLVVVLPAAHPVAQRGVLRLADLRDLPMRLVSDRPGTAFGQRLIDACRRAGFEPRVQLSTGDLELLLAEIGAGEASWTVLYASRARRINATSEAFCDLDAPDLEANTYLLVRRADQRAATRAFVTAAHLQHDS